MVVDNDFLVKELKLMKSVREYYQGLVEHLLKYREEVFGMIENKKLEDDRLIDLFLEELTKSSHVRRTGGIKAIVMRKSGEVTTGLMLIHGKVDKTDPDYKHDVRRFGVEYNKEYTAITPRVIIREDVVDENLIGRSFKSVFYIYYQRHEGWFKLVVGE